MSRSQPPIHTGTSANGRAPVNTTRSPSGRSASSIAARAPCRRRRRISAASGWAAASCCERGGEVERRPCPPRTRPTKTIHLRASPGLPELGARRRPVARVEQRAVDAVGDEVDAIGGDPERLGRLRRAPGSPRRRAPRAAAPSASWRRSDGRVASTSMSEPCSFTTVGSPSARTERDRRDAVGIRPGPEQHVEALRAAGGICRQHRRGVERRRQRVPEAGQVRHARVRAPSRPSMVVVAEARSSAVPPPTSARQARRPGTRGWWPAPPPRTGVRAPRSAAG